LAGTVAMAAAGHGGPASDLRFTLGGAAVDARADGTATIDTRGLADGAHTLVATAVVAGRDVHDEISVQIDNALASTAAVGTGGGALASAAGSITIIPPGALSQNTTASVQDATQQSILNDFG